MTTSVNQQENLAVVRLLEFLSDRTPWQRSLWGIGLALALEELHEACCFFSQSHLSESSIKRMISTLVERVGQHTILTGDERRVLQQNLLQLQKDPQAGRVAHFTIQRLAATVSVDYVTKWGKLIASGTFDVELFARSVAAHLLDAGFSGEYLHEFINTRMKAVTPFSLARLCDELQHEIAASPVRDFQVLLAFSRSPKLKRHTSLTWLDAPSVINWLNSHGFNPAGVNAKAALVLTVKARDMLGAAQAARIESDRFAARTLLATGYPLDRVPKLWVAGSAAPVKLDHDRRGVAVRGLERERRIFSAEADKSVDAALELLAHLDGSSPAAAVAGGWGAIEGLLAPPNDRSSAADNLAGLVAASFPRAELTKLAYTIKEHAPGHSPTLESATTNRERARIVGEMILADNVPSLPGLSDQAAVARMRSLIRNPKKELKIVREAISESFHRLYRQRNLILHAGKLDSVALTPGLRTVAKLAGAGMDRVTHGHYVQSLKPLDLVAKANIALEFLDSSNPLACVELLETT